MRRSLFYLAGSTCLTLVVALGSYWLWQNHKQKRLCSSKYRISTIIQTGPEKQALKASYLAQLLGLSMDQPTQLYAFDPKNGERKLLECPLIANAKIKRAPPDAIYLDYEIKKPVA